MAFSSRMRQLSWASGSPPAAAEHRAGLALAKGPGTLARAISAMHVVGPAKAEAELRTGTDDARLLLQIAAEVEHAFLLQYLYAAYSLNGDVPQAADAAATLVEVARQEMAHLVTVQNVLMAIGEQVDLSREDFPAHPDQYPFPAALEPLSSPILAKYVVAEAPPLEDISDPQMSALARKAATEAATVVPKIHRVGAVYAALYWLFQAGDAAEGPWRLPDDVVAALIVQFGAGHHVRDEDFAPAAVVGDVAASKDEWGGDPSMHVDAGAPRDRALAALATIAQQGEGPVISPDMRSHFEILLGLYGSFPDWPANAVRDIPANPQIGAADDAENLITNTVTADWARLLNARYRTLLLDIAIGLSLQRSVDAALRATLVGEWAIGEMLAGISPIAQALTQKLRGTDAANPKFAGAPFVLGDILPTSECDRWKQLGILLDESGQLLSRLLAAEPLSDGDRDVLQGLQAFDADRRAVITERIAAHCV
jgi:hypothetical protein